LEELRLPIINLTLGHCRFAALRVAVPKAAMDEDYLPPARENEVRSSGKIGSVQPEAVAEGVGRVTHALFGRRILWFDGSHQGAAGLWRQTIHPLLGCTP
jgi:hypothetical protein